MKCRDTPRGCPVSNRRLKLDGILRFQDSFDYRHDWSLRAPGYSSFSVLDIQVAVWMLLLYKWRLFGCKKQSKSSLPPAAARMIKVFRDTPNPAKGPAGPLDPLLNSQKEVFGRSLLLPLMRGPNPDKGLCPLHFYFTLASRDASCSFCLRFSSRT